MVAATKEDQDWIDFWAYMEDLQVGVCLAYLEEQSIAWARGSV